MGRVATLDKNDINLEFDSQTREYYIIWKPVVIGMGETRGKALEDLREAAHFGADILIDLKLENIKRED